MAALSRVPLAIWVVVAAIPVLLLGHISERSVTHAASKGQAIGFHIAAYLVGLLLTLIVSRLLLRLFGRESLGMANLASAIVLGFGFAMMAITSSRPGSAGATLIDILGYPLAVVATPQAVWLLGDLATAGRT